VISCRPRICQRAKHRSQKALAVGMAEKAKEFIATGSEIYQGNLPDGAK